MGELALVLLGLLGAAVGNYPIPILAAQILAIDLLGEIGPLTLLTYDPPSRNTMTRPPRKPSEHMLNLFSASEVTSIGIFIGGLAFANFFLFMIRQGITLTMDSVGTIQYMTATSLSYATIVFAQYINILERRYERRSLFNRNFFSNRIVLVSILISIGLVSFALYTPYVSDFFGFGSPSLIDWGFVLLSTAVFLVGFEGLKAVKRLKNN